jgi:hypothetical protein
MSSCPPVLFAGLAALAAGGCAINPAPFTEYPVGPALIYRPPSPRSLNEGYLRVYSDTITHEDGGVRYFPHSSYTVHFSDGTLVKSVQNHVGLDDDSPTIVRMPPGAYNVIGRSAAFGRVTVPVVIESGMLTQVFLEHGGMFESGYVSKTDNGAAFVKAPDGSIVGWRARTAPTGH